MARRNFYEIINERPFNLHAEYDRIYKLFYGMSKTDYSVLCMTEEAFDHFPKSLIGRTISLEDFDKTYGFNFPEDSSKIAIDDLITFCEYVYTFCDAVALYGEDYIDEDDRQRILRTMQTIGECMNDLAQMPLQRKDITIFVPADPAAVSVAEIASPELAVSILEYHHHALKGNLAKKKAILKVLADDIEPLRHDLSSINASFTSTFFQMLQKFVRHNNTANAYISSLSDGETEAYYDDIYQMWLLAKLELDNVERKKRATRCLDKINS